MTAQALPAPSRGIGRLVNDARVITWLSLNRQNDER